MVSGEGRRTRLGMQTEQSAKESVFLPPQTIVAQKHQMSPLILPKEELLGKKPQTPPGIVLALSELLLQFTGAPTHT